MDKAETAPIETAPSKAPQTEGERLLERYGDHLCADLDNAQKEQILCALWQIMLAVVDLGFDLKAGDNSNPKCAMSFDDVLEYLELDSQEPEAAAPDKNNNKTEQT